MRDLFRDTFIGFVRVHLLHHAGEKPIFGTEMIEELRRHGYVLSPGTLYPMLHALQSEGYLRSEVQVIDGKLRRYYRSTPAGRKVLAQLKRRIRELVDEVLEGGMPAPRPAPMNAPVRRAAARPPAGRDAVRAKAPARTVVKAPGRARRAR